MSDDRIDSLGKNVNACGLSPYEIRSSEGGDNREGSLGQKRATSIIATGNKSRKGGDMGRDSLLKGRG